MAQKICVITGANSGIGKQAAVQIANRGHIVVLACRNLKRGQQAVDEIKKKTNNEHVSLFLVDMSLQSSIRECAKNFYSMYPRLDVLIHNAAHFDIRQKSIQFTDEDIELVWSTNHIGPVLLTDLMLDALKKSSQGRIIIVSSKGLVAHPFLKVNVMDPEFRSKRFSVARAYYQSKLAQVMYTYWLADRLKETAITVNAIRVTNVKNDLSRYPHLSFMLKALYSLKSRFSIPPAQMAETYTYLALSEDVARVSGSYFDSPQKKVFPSSYAQNPENIERVMQCTREFINLDYSRVKIAADARHRA